MQHMDIEAWMQHITGGDSLRSIAKRIKVSPSTISRYIERNGTLSAEHAIKIARAYGTSVVDALVDTGYIYKYEAGIVGVKEALRFATNQELLDTMLERVDPNATGDVDDEAAEMFHGDSETITPKFDNVHHLENPPVSTPDDHDDGTVHHWDGSLDHLIAADSSPDEDALREEEGVDPID